MSRKSAHRAKAVAIVIVGYKSRPFLERLFASLQSQTFQDFDVIYVDNSRGDGSSTWLKENSPATTILEQTVNRGFAGGNNIGIKLALEAGYSRVFLLNPDTYLAKDCLEQLVSADDAVVQPLILMSRDGQPSEVINTAGNPLTYLGFSYAGGYLESFHGQFPSHPAIASGAACLWQANALRETGGFDEIFFTYHEDVDLCWRARMLGYQISLVSEAKVWHEYSFSRNSRKFYYIERNRLLFLTKCFSFWTLILILPIGLAGELMMCLYALVAGFFGAKLTSYLGYWQLLPVIWRERQLLQQARRVSDRQLAAYLSTDLDVAAIKIPGVGIVNALSRAYWWLIRPLIF